MRRFKFAVFVAFMIFVFSSVSGWAQCPADTVDLGDCDTLHLVAVDTLCESFPCNVEIMILVTHDLNDIPGEGYQDSLSSIVTPFTWSTNNPSKFCTLSSTKTVLYDFLPDFPNSIFRHPVEGEQSDSNRMALMANDFSGRDWDNILFDYSSDTTDVEIGGEHVIRPNFRLALIAGGGADQLWWESNRVLLATMTFTVEDEMTICIDTVFWPPNSKSTYTRMDAKKFVPRLDRPPDSTWCFNIKYPSSVKEIEGTTENKPKVFSLAQNYPNPFNAATNFRFTLPRASQVEINIFNIRGQRVKTIVDNPMEAGVYVVDWDGTDQNGDPVSSGIYFYRMNAGDFSDMKKMVLLK